MHSCLKNKRERFGALGLSVCLQTRKQACLHLTDNLVCLKVYPWVYWFPFQNVQHCYQHPDGGESIFLLKHIFPFSVHLPKTVAIAHFVPSKCETHFVFLESATNEFEARNPVCWLTFGRLCSLIMLDHVLACGGFIWDVNNSTAACHLKNSKIKQLKLNFHTTGHIFTDFFKHYLFIVCLLLCAGTWVPRCMYRGHWTAFRIMWLSPSTMWYPRLKFRFRIGGKAPSPAASFFHCPTDF